MTSELLTPDDHIKELNALYERSPPPDGEVIMRAAIRIADLERALKIEREINNDLSKQVGRLSQTPDETPSAQPVAQRIWIDGSDESNLGFWEYQDVDASEPLHDGFEALYSQPSVPTDCNHDWETLGLGSFQKCRTCGSERANDRSPNREHEEHGNTSRPDLLRSRETPTTAKARQIDVGGRSPAESAIIKALRSQRQLDRDGVEVGVSRQACDEAADILERAALPPNDAHILICTQCETPDVCIEGGRACDVSDEPTTTQVEVMRCITCGAERPFDETGGSHGQEA